MATSVSSPQEPPVPDEAEPDHQDDLGASDSHQTLHDDDDANMDEENAGQDENDQQDEAGEEDLEDEDDEEEEEDLSSSAPPTRVKDHRSRKRRRRDKMFQDCVSIQIPLDVTADLGIAIRRTRRKRIEALTRSFPELIENKNETTEADTKENPMESSVKGETTIDGEDDDDDADRRNSSPKTDFNSPPRESLSHVPRREDYANVVDYLEAKYAQGVMINDDDDDAENGETGGKADADDDEGQGSVYSQSSFLDDRDLQRDVAEQVLAQSTTTKLELESNNDDAFFVNVGNLEVEESDLTKDGYDPVNDVENVKKPKKKRKPTEPKEKKDTKSAASSEKTKEKKKSTAKAAITKEKETKATSSAKKKAEGSEPSKKKAKTTSKSAASKKKEKKPPSEAEKAAAAKRKEVDKAYKEVVRMIKAMAQEDLPRRKTMEKVAITCPPDKKPGDSVLFANPHVPGQRLKVKIPKKTMPGGTFKVSVPVASNADEDENDNTDHNKWSREFYDCFGEYCNLYDEWVELVAIVKQEQEITDYVVYFEKRNKFDELIKDVPQDLKTPLDKSYFQKLLRRSRQNRHKRERTLKRQEEKAKELLHDQSDGDQEDQGDSKPATASSESPEKKAVEDDDAEHNEDPPSRTVSVPHLSTAFPTIKFNPADWS